MTVKSVLNSKTTMYQALTSPKRIAFALIGILQNNIVTLPLYTGMMLLDALIHFYVIVMMIMHSRNEDNALNVVRSYQLMRPGQVHLVGLTSVTVGFLVLISLFMVFIY